MNVESLLSLEEDEEEEGGGGNDLVAFWDTHRICGQYPVKSKILCYRSRINSPSSSASSSASSSFPSAYRLAISFARSWFLYTRHTIAIFWYTYTYTIRNDIYWCELVTFGQLSLPLTRVLISSDFASMSSASSYSVSGFSKTLVDMLAMLYVAATSGCS
jgi:hypothetical protein